MKIVMVGPFGLRPHGTMSRRALPLAKELAARGHQVNLVLPPWDCPQDSGRSWDEEGVRICNIVLPAAVSLWREASITTRLVSDVLKDQPDVVHLFKPKAYAGLTGVLLWYLRKLGFTQARIVVDTDDREGPGGWNDVAPYSWGQRHVFAWQEKWGMTRCQALTVASRELASLALAMGVPAERVFHLPNGVGAVNTRRGEDSGDGVRSKWGLGGAPVVLLYTRFFEFQAERVVRMLRRVLDQEPSVRLLVVGKGLFGEDERFLSLAEEVGLGARTSYVGWRDHEELQGYFAAADLAILPLEDTLLNRARCPAKVVDLMAAGMPLVADDVGEVGYYVQHLSSGYLVPPGDEAAFVAAVLRLLGDEPLRLALGEKARQRMLEHFSWTRLAGVVEGAYQA